ncbi:MAG: agmatine deiminase family protein, partial [Robiginitomaculum sp.]|nr:agmatine deiminase family protein [Robiginitomaculum sp.]
VANIEMEDIWMRDFSLSNAVDPIMFRYTAEGQSGGEKGQKLADIVQENFARFAEKHSLQFRETDYLNDGGNFVDDYAGSVVISRKFLRDNELTETEGRSILRKTARVANVAFIEADEQGGLEHADGVVAFIDTNILVVNSYPEDEQYTKSLHDDLKSGLPGVKIHKIITPYDGSSIYDKKFGSACGLYTNMLVTPKHIYFPQFGILEDEIALRQIKKWSDKKIIPIQSSSVCNMGGGVRCMSWQVRGEPAATLLRGLRLAESEKQ